MGACCLPGKTKRPYFRHPRQPRMSAQLGGQRPHEAGLAGAATLGALSREAELLLSQGCIWSFCLWANRIHRLPGCADHLQ